MFNDIENIKHNHVVVIQDTADVPGKILIKEFISTSSKSEFHVFCYDCNYQDLIDEFKIDQSIPIYYYDCLPMLSTSAETEDKLIKFISSIKSVKFSSKKLIIIVDSLSTLLLEKSLHSVYRILRQITFLSSSTGVKPQVQMMVMLHEDTIINPIHIIKQIKNVCRAWIEVRSKIINVSIRKSSGKLFSQSYEYECSVDGKLIYKRMKNIIAHNTRDEDPVNEPVSTFRLTLNESEKKARDAVKLPYERHEEETCSSAGGEIFYMPDESDDWDEEDPDNDLEFS